MKNLLTLALALCALGATVSCIDEQYTHHSFNSVIESSDSDQLDNMMTVWFEEFNENQNNGANMKAADQWAITAAIKAINYQPIK